MFGLHFFRTKRAQIETGRVLAFVYALGIFYTLAVVLPVFINSTYLEMIVSKRYVGLLFTVSAAISLVGLFLLPRAIKRWGTKRIASSLLLVDGIALALLAYFASVWAVLTGLIVHLAVVPFVYFMVDIYLESDSLDETTGSTRGLYLTFNNAAWLIAPFLSGLILAEHFFSRLYAAAALLLLPCLILVLQIRPRERGVSTDIPGEKEIHRVLGSPDLRNTAIVSFILQFFFALMVIYAPIYLHEVIGFNFKEIGLIFTVALSAYVLVELPLGRLADKKLGEQELLIIGLLIASITTILISLTHESSIVLWILLLFVNRLGAAMVEVMTETHFFKHISFENTEMLSIFRATMPLAYVVAPIAVTIFLQFFNLEYLFLALGILMFTGIYFAERIVDTK